MGNPTAHRRRCRNFNSRSIVIFIPRIIQIKSTNEIYIYIYIYIFIQRHENFRETMSNKDEAKDTGVDPNSWYPPLPPNHPDNARLYALPVPSKCPVENGVIKTNWGAVSAGPILAGIAAGLEPQNVRLGELLRAEWQSRAALSSTTLDNKWIATIGSACITAVKFIFQFFIFCICIFIFNYQFKLINFINL